MSRWLLTEEEKESVRRTVERGFSQTAGEYLEQAVLEVDEMFREWARNNIDWKIVILP